MTTLTSMIALGREYIDERTMIRGHAVALFFNENGCVEVVLQNVKDDESKLHYIEYQRLTPYLDGPAPIQTYETDVEFGKEYVDKQTGIRGWAAVLEFHEYMANRVSLRSKGEDREGNAKILYHSIDDFLLAPADGGPEPKRKDDKPSSVTRQVERR